MTDTRKPDQKTDQKSNQRPQTTNPSKQDHNQKSGGTKSDEQKRGPDER
jgi:hypothetical protein